MTNSKYQYFELSNGVRACLVPVKGLSSVTVQVFVKIGSKYEESKVWGISHFLEHMAFKGTRKRKTATQISKEFDQIGSMHNASTNHEYTEYYVKTVPGHIEWGVEILSDMLLNPTFPEKELKKELGVVVEEINMYEDTPMRGIGGEFYKLMYKSGKVGCWNILGSKKSVLSIEKSDLVSFRDNYLNSKEMVVVVAGNLGGNEEKIKGWIKKYFSGFTGSKVGLPEIKMELSEKKEWRKKKGLDQAHFILGLPTIKRDDDRRHGMKLLDIILAGNTSSRLYQRIREKMGAAYYVFSVSDRLKEAGFSGVQAGVTKNKLEKVIEETKKEYLLVEKQVKEDELLMAKDYLKGRLALLMDRSDFWADFVGEKLLLNRELTKVSEEIEGYEKVSLEEVKKIAKEFFSEEKFRLAVID